MKKENENTVVLNEKLKKALDKVQNTPLLEPEIYKVFDKKPVKKSQAINIILDRSDLKSKDFSAMDIANLYAEAVSKITDWKLEDGTFKSTPLTEEFNLPNFDEVEELFDLVTAITENEKERTTLMIEASKSKEKKITKKLEKCISEYSEKIEELDKLTWSISGLDKDSLSAWEQQLVTQQILSCIKEVQNTTMGKQ